MFDVPEMLSRFYGEYKESIFGRKNKVSLFIYKNFIEGTAAEHFDGKFYEHDFNVKFEYVKDIRREYIEGKECLVIDYLDEKAIVNKDRITSIIFPNMSNLDEAMETLLSLREKNREEKRIKLQKEQERAEQELLRQQKYHEECQIFYKDCYKFHITADNNPYYELQSGDMQFAGIYIDKEKNLNFLKIDGYRQEESNACISYNKIHYYEKAGNVHYISDTKGNYSNFGGSISGATVSKKASVLGGLLFGPMGMAAGALLTHKPAKMEMPGSTLSISSEPHKIDDRSVILNYYSDTKQQLIDIELPADIYNFLQTYLPEKRYGIVSEIEKKNAVKQYERTTEAIEGAAPQMLTASNDMEVFENRIKKLKIMYDNGILSEEEYANEKKRILSEL